MAADFSTAEKEVLQTLKPVMQCIKIIGISLNDDQDCLLYRIIRNLGCISATILLSSLIVYVVLLLIDSSRASVAGFVACIHIIGYGIMSYSKCLTLCLKQPVYKQLVQDLMTLWPVTTDSEEAEIIKQKSLRTLGIFNYCYMFINIVGVIFYNATPAAVHFYNTLRGIPSDLGYVWFTVYPYDKTEPVYHELTYLFEMYTTGLVAVMAMLGSDMLFTSMSSHITLLLRLLQLKIRDLGKSENKLSGTVDCYEETVSVIKIHQRLISYSNDIEDLFSLVNLINFLLSSVNICCVVFNIVLLEPWNVVSSKFFLVSAINQMGILCWYADEIYRASLAVADAVFESGWYRSSPRCRRAMLMLILRSQKPVCFTAMKFRNITLMTYSSILTTSYSYFALLYTVYRD